MIVYTPGVWDVLHFGHINVIKKAKEYGDTLIVGVCSDRLCRLHGKNPVIPEADRAEIIAALRWVDKVHIYDNPDQTEALKLFQANTFVVGEEFGSQGVPEHANALSYCEQTGIPIVRLPRSPGVSSSDLKKKISTTHREKVTKGFWEARASLVKNNDLGLFQATSLTPTEEAAVKRKDNDLAAILHTLKKSTHDRKLLLDLGCGVGRITLELAKEYQRIHAIDYVQDFIDVAKQSNVDNVQWRCAEAHDFDPLPYNCCLLSGLLVYLTDESMEKVLEAISYIPTVVLKESVGTFGRFELSDDHYSAELKSTYTGTYRTPCEIITAFTDRGYALNYTEIVERHRQETNLQVFLFEK